jgi:hypothetical protein
MRDFLTYRFAPFLGFATLNFLAVYCLVTGKMIGMLGSIVEGRHSAPIPYWTYMAFLVIGAIILDVALAKTIIADNPRKVVPNQSTDPALASGTPGARQEPRHR